MQLLYSVHLTRCSDVKVYAWYGAAFYTHAYWIWLSSHGLKNITTCTINCDIFTFIDFFCNCTVRVWISGASWKWISSITAKWERNEVKVLFCWIIANILYIIIHLCLFNDVSFEILNKETGNRRIIHVFWVGWEQLEAFVLWLSWPSQPLRSAILSI